MGTDTMRSIQNPFEALISNSRLNVGGKLRPQSSSISTSSKNEPDLGADRLHSKVKQKAPSGKENSTQSANSSKIIENISSKRQEPPIDAEIDELTKKIEFLTGSKVILDPPSERKIDKQKNQSVRPINDRFSVGGMASNRKHDRMSSIGVRRTSLDVRDFDLDEVKKHRMSLLMAPSFEDDNSSTSPIDTISMVGDQKTSAPAGPDCTLLEFCSVGVNRDILSGRKMPSWDNRRQEVQVIDVFPTQTPLIEDIAEYCFPGGASLEVLTEDEALRMVRNCKECLHILHFSDANGKPTYATVLTVTEVLPVNFTKFAHAALQGGMDTENADLVAYLLILRKRVRAATTIQRFMAMRTKGFRYTRPKECRMGNAVVEVMKLEKDRVRKQREIKSGATVTKGPVGNGNLSLPSVATDHSVSTAYSMTGMWDRWMATRSASLEADQAVARAGCESKRDGDVNKLEESELYDFFDDEDEESTVITSTSSDDGIRFRSRTASSIPEEAISTAISVDAVTAGARTDMNKYYIFTERAFCVLHDRPHHQAMSKILRIIAAKESQRIVPWIHPGSGHLGANAESSLGGDTSPGSFSGSLASCREDEARIKARIIATANMISTTEQADADSAKGATTCTDSERTRSISSSSALSVGSLSVSEHTIPRTIDLKTVLACDLLYAARAPRRHAFLTYVQGLPLQKYSFVKANFPAYCLRPFTLSRSSTSSISSRHKKALLGESTHSAFNQAYLHEAEEWMTATLFSLLPAEVVVQTLSILLMERSVVLYSSDAGLVSTISTALVALMAPFRWAGAFIPLLPINYSEIMQAPVPFLVGTNKAPHLNKDVSSDAAVLFIDDYLQSSAAFFEGMAGTTTMKGTLRRRKKYLSVPKGQPTHPDGGKLDKLRSEATGGGESYKRSTLCHVDHSVDIALVSDPSMMSGGQRLCAKIRALSQQLRVGDKDSARGESVLSVAAATLQMNAFCKGMTSAERSAVTSLRLVCRSFTREILGDMVVAEDDLDLQLAARKGKFQHDDLQEGYTWARYGVLSTTNEEDFTFYPDWYLDQHRNKLQFLSTACTSQYFLTFVDELHIRDIKRQKCRVLIKDWLSFRMHLKKKG